MTDHVRPFAEIPGGPVDSGAALGDLVDTIATALEVAAIVIPTEELGPMPALLLNFTGADKPVTVALVCPPDGSLLAEWAELSRLLRDATAAAIAASFEARP